MSPFLRLTGEFDDEDAGLGMLKTVLVVGRLWGALGIQHEHLTQRNNTSVNEDSSD